MNESDIIAFITGAFPGAQTVTAGGNTFFFLGEERNFPVATLVTSDQYDQASDLDRAGVYRLNIGLNRDTYVSHFGPPPSRPGASGVVETGHDFTALDQLMPHPVYASMFWICVLNPSEATFREVVAPMLAEAFERGR